MVEPTEKRVPPALRCLRGRSVTPEIMADLDRIEAVPGAARRQLFRVLGPLLLEPVPDTKPKLDEFCRELGVPGDDLARVLKACRFLLRQAAMTNLTADQFAEDLVALGDTGALAASLLSGYDEALKLIRLEIMAGALADHGKALQQVSWRLDRIDVSNRGDRLDVPVVVLTLGYVEGGRRERITLHAGVDSLRELRAMCDRLLS
jgi:hypothetical protein